MMDTDNSAQWLIDGVAREALENDWDEAWPYLERAVKRFPNVHEKYTEASVYRALTRGTMQLWLGWSIEDECVMGAALTEIVTSPNHPDKLFLSIPLLGADGWNNWGDAMWITLKRWGISKGCTHALGYGRKGWQRLYGFDEIGKTEDGVTIMIRKLKDH